MYDTCVVGINKDKVMGLTLLLLSSGVRRCFRGEGGAENQYLSMVSIASCKLEGSGDMLPQENLKL